MKDYYDILKNCTLLKGFDSELQSVLTRLGAHIKHFNKNDIIRHAGSEITETGIVVSGMAHIAKIDIEGNKNIIIELRESQSFGEMLAFAETKKSPVNILAATNCSIVFIPVKKIIEVCSSFCEYSGYLIKNTVKFMAEKSMMLHIKNDILAQKTIREKLLTYFYYETNAVGTLSFKIPFSREGMAEFLCVNTSALSRELAKLQDEGILTFRRNHFKLKNRPSEN